MTIRFAKHHNRPATLQCLRDDGSSSWFTASAADGEYFIAHDLLHYAVECVVGYTKAFFGMVADGRDLNDFGRRHGQADTVPLDAQATDAERLVGLLQTMGSNGVMPEYGAVRAAWQLVDDPTIAPDLPVTETQFREIWSAWNRLTEYWRGLDADGHLELTFPRPTASLPA